MDAAPTGSDDAAIGKRDAAIDCHLQSQRCPDGCREFSGELYNQQRRCLELQFEVIACWPLAEGSIDDPSCARKVSTSEIFRVPLSFFDPGDQPREPNWAACTTTEDINFVSSTVTPLCDDLEDGGIYDGAP